MNLSWVLDLLLLAVDPKFYSVVDKLLAVRSRFPFNLVSRRGIWVTPVERHWEDFSQLKGTEWVTPVERHWDDFTQLKDSE